MPRILFLNLEPLSGGGPALVVDEPQLKTDPQTSGPPSLTTRPFGRSSHAAIFQMSIFRSIAIIAHVDHGKTTLLDHMLRQSGTLRDHGAAVDRVMDSDPQERERGITILAKCTAIEWRGERIQIIDTPGHQDFGGEVERILRMVDSVLLLVDAVEGPMPQTRYVLRKALEHGYRPIVVLNKMDRPAARPVEALDEIFDLFAALGASDEQLDFPVIYAAGRDGWASPDAESAGEGLTPLFEAIVEHVPLGAGDAQAPLQLQVSTLDYSRYLGRIAIGRIHAGTISRGMHAVCCRRDGSCDNFRVTKLMGFLGLERIGGIMIYDVTDPTAPVFVEYVNQRDFAAATEAAGDLAPEGIAFVPADVSPTGAPLLIVANEFSGTTTVYEVTGGM